MTKYFKKFKTHPWESSVEACGIYLFVWWVTKIVKFVYKNQYKFLRMANDIINACSGFGWMNILAIACFFYILIVGLIALGREL